MLGLSAQPGPLHGAAHLHSPLSITLLSRCSWGAAAGEEGREPLSPQGTSSPRPQELRLLLCHHPPAAIPGGRGEGQSSHTALRRAGTQGGAQQPSGHPTTTTGGCGAGRVCWRLARGSAALPCPALHRTAAPACSHTQGRDTAICRHPNQHTNLIPRAAYCRNRSEGEAWAVPAGDCREPRSAPGLSQRSTGKQGQSYEEKIRVSSSSDLVITQSNTTSATEKCSWPRKFKHVYNFIHICKCAHV